MEHIVKRCVQLLLSICPVRIRPKSRAIRHTFFSQGSQNPWAFMQAEIETILDRATVNSSIGGAPPGIGRPTNGWHEKSDPLFIPPPILIDAWLFFWP